MVQLPDTVEKAITKQNILPVATSNQDCVPNVILHFPSKP